MRRLGWLTCGVLLLLAAPVMAQSGGLDVQDTAIINRQDAYGRDVPFVVGQLVNDGSDAYTNIALTAAAFDLSGEQVGEGIGYLVNACGAGLLPEFQLRPGHAQRFEVPLEMYDETAQISTAQVTPDASVSASASQPTGTPETTSEPTGDIQQFSDDEIVAVEWQEDGSLLFGAGCDDALFTRLRWSRYDPAGGDITSISHPHTDSVTPLLRQRIGLTDDALFERSNLSFAPQGRRVVYQGEANVFQTSEADGTYVRTLYSDLYNRTLQGIQWLTDSRFLAYYFGAYGDPVYYFTADEEGRPISLSPARQLPSTIVPGVSPDGRRAVIAGTFFETAGYYLKSINNNNDPRLLFEADPPGNNYPAPLFAVDAGDPTFERVYVARPVDGEPRLQCYNLSQNQLVDLAALPLRISTDERAWWALAPDHRTVALAASGVSGGLWLIDLAMLPPCSLP